jgi:plastocyanin
MKKRRYVVAAIVAVAGFSALFAVLPSQGAGFRARLEGNRFRPATIAISPGGAITFTNDDDVSHTATCQGKGCPKDSGDIHAGQIKTLTFPQAGTFALVCRYHGTGGMTAEVTVGR